MSLPTMINDLVSKLIPAKDLFSDSQKKAIMKAIQKAEANTSGEVCVHIEQSCKGDVIERAKEIFTKLEIVNTKLKNGVLFYLAVNDKKFAILGDAGINAVVPDNFWNQIKDNMLERFKEQKFTEGLCEGIEMAGKQLQQYFPCQPGNTNELSDEISFS
jgi:uncharacterized membrane protein